MTTKRGYHLWNIETSKLILLVSYVIAVILTVIVVIGTFLDKDMSNVTQIALISWGEVTASNIWYYKKAARENVFKNIPEKYLENIDINNLL